MTSTTLAFPTPASLGSLDHYIQAVNRFPLLTAEQQTKLDKLESEHRKMMMHHGFLPPPPPKDRPPP